MCVCQCVVYGKEMQTGCYCGTNVLWCCGLMSFGSSALMCHLSRLGQSQHGGLDCTTIACYSSRGVVEHHGGVCSIACSAIE